MKIYELKKEDENDWDEYVFKSNNSTFYHQIGWKNVVEETYDHRSHYLIAKENNEIKGILPLFLMKSIFFGNKLVSIPFAPYGGACTNNKIIENVLINEAKKLTEFYDADYLEIKNRPLKENSNSHGKSAQVTSILLLHPNPNIMWDKLKRDKKRGIKKAKKANIEVIWSLEQINEFYDLYSQTMRHLGSPAHSMFFFKNIIKKFPNNTNIIITKYNDRVVGCIFLLFYKNTVISGWSASDKKYLNIHPIDLSYWEGIKYFCENQYEILDFGRSMLNSGVHEFKKSFGAETRYLNYQYYLNGINEIPNNTISSTKRQKFAQVWKRLPKTLTNRLGPVLRSNFS